MAGHLFSPTIRVQQLKKLILDKVYPIRLFDTAYTLKEPQKHDEFIKNSYGKIEQLMKTKSHPDYLSAHIPRAVHFNLEIASYPGKYERAALYPPSIFQEYVQRLGVNKDDKVVVYGRGPGNGMLFAARAWWLLKMYGMSDVSVLEGGLEKWVANGGETTKDIPQVERGNWEATEPRADLIVYYEELSSEKEGKSLFERLDTVNFLDCRPAEEFYGTKPLAFPPNGATGARIAGSKCVPLSAIMSKSGELKDKKEILDVLHASSFSPSHPTYTVCNGGTQAALLGLALAKAGINFKLYNGSLREVSKRRPELISARG